MKTKNIEIANSWNIRIILVCFSAVSISLPVAWISIAKVLIFIFSLAYIIFRTKDYYINHVFKILWTPRLILIIISVFSLSVIWTSANMEVAFLSIVKHGKLLEIILLMVLIRNEREARIAISAFLTGQIFLLISSWSLTTGISIPWRVATSSDYVVFSSYLDQSIIFATSAAIFFNISYIKQWPRWVGLMLSLFALTNVLFLLKGRTGHLLALLMISFMFFGATAKKYRLTTAVFVPLIFLLSLHFIPNQLQERLSQVISESQSFFRQGDVDSSSGWRINAWHRSLQAIDESPWIGHGVGSWTTEIKRIEGDSADMIFGPGLAGNPHQEYLLWGVELGAGGIILLLLLIIFLFRDARQFEARVARSIYAVTGCMAVACLFNSVLYDALLGDYFSVVLGLLLALGYHGQAKFRSTAPAVGLMKEVS